MNINFLIKAGKIAGIVLPAVGALLGGLAASKENANIVAETTKKLFEEQSKK